MREAATDLPRPRCERQTSRVDVVIGPDCALTAAQAARFEQAIALLRAGKAAQALIIAQALAHEAPQAADSQQLLGMALANTGQMAAGDAFRRALGLAPDSAVVALNYAAWLRGRERLAEAAAVLERAPESAQTRLQLGLLALQMREYTRAATAFRRAIALRPDAVTAWHGLGSALRGTGELEAAVEAFLKATELAPDYAPGWINLGGVQRLLGRIEEALVSLRRAEALGHRGPELHDALNGVLSDLGRIDEALAGARRVVVEFPDHVSGYRTLSRLLWEYGPELAPQEDALAALGEAARIQADNLPLQWAYVGMLLAARRSVEAFDWLQGMRRRGVDGAMLDWYSAEASDALGRGEQAAGLFAAAQRRLGDLPDFLNAYARHAFRRREYDRAQACAERAVSLAPGNQEAWSHLGTAWRLQEDPREHWLFDYDRLVGYVEVPPPPGFDDLPEFLAALARVLDPMHTARREPVNQSVRGGSQTPGRLFGRNDACIRAAESVLRRAVQDWLSTLPDDPSHPFLSRKRSSVRFVGSWSVRLRSSGRHSNHVHNEGWMSSAFHVALPASVGQPGSDLAGWIQFGQPLEELGLDLPPRRVIRPRAGYLALFPSYTWHGTVPFVDAEPRLTIAFDMQPA